MSLCLFLWSSECVCVFVCCCHSVTPLQTGQTYVCLSLSLSLSSALFSSYPSNVATSIHVKGYISFLISRPLLHLSVSLPAPLSISPYLCVSVCMRVCLSACLSHFVLHPLISAYPISRIQRRFSSGVPSSFPLFVHSSYLLPSSSSDFLPS